VISVNRAKPNAIVCFKACPPVLITAVWVTLVALAITSVVYAVITPLGLTLGPAQAVVLGGAGLMLAGWLQWRLPVISRESWSGDGHLVLSTEGLQQVSTDGFGAQTLRLLRLAKARHHLGGLTFYCITPTGRSCRFTVWRSRLSDPDFHRVCLLSAWLSGGKP
jgi:hypothetical protein